MSGHKYKVRMKPNLFEDRREKDASVNAIRLRSVERISDQPDVLRTD